MNNISFSKHRRQKPNPAILETINNLSKETSTELREAIQKSLLDLLGGDPAELDAERLMLASRFAHRGHELILTLIPQAKVIRGDAAPESQVAWDLMANAIGQNMGGPPMVYGSTSNPSSSMGGWLDGDEPMSLEAGHGETYGAKMTRELVAAIGAKHRKDKQESFTDIVDAIAKARASGLDSVATKLEKHLDEVLASEPEPSPKPRSSPVRTAKPAGEGALV